MKKIILITGWLGYIWSHAVVEFEKAGYKTVIVDNLSNSYSITLDWIWEILWYRPDFYEVDIQNKVKLSMVFKKYTFDGVIHFAGAKSPFESQDNPLYYYNNNVASSIHLFDLMNIYDVKNIIFSSSANVYHADNISPISESDQIGPNNPYGRTKFLLEEILHDLHQFSNFNTVLLRYFNPIGSHVSWLIWEHLEWVPNNIFPYIMKVASGEISELKVFGDDYDTKDGSGVRDYIDINDLVHGHMLAYQYIENQNEPVFDVFNLGVWKWVSVLELVCAVEKYIDHKVAYSIAPRRPWDLAEVYCDVSKAHKVLGFTALYSIDDSITHTWDFYNKRKLISKK